MTSFIAHVDPSQSTDDHSMTSFIAPVDGWQSTENQSTTSFSAQQLASLPTLTDRNWSQSTDQSISNNSNNNTRASTREPWESQQLINWSLHKEITERSKTKGRLWINQNRCSRPACVSKTDAKSTNDRKELSTALHLYDSTTDARRVIRECFIHPQ